MKLNGPEMPKGEFFYRALVTFHDDYSCSWRISDRYFSSMDEAKLYFDCAKEIRWPVEEIAPGVIYIPTEDELLEN